MAIWLSYALRQKNIIQIPLILSECVNHWYVLKSECGWTEVETQTRSLAKSNFVVPKGAKLINNRIKYIYVSVKSPPWEELIKH